MTEVLRPRLERLGVELTVISDLDKRVPEQVRIEIWQTRSRTGFAEEIANRVSVSPWRAIERSRAECVIVAGSHLGFRE